MAPNNSADHFIERGTYREYRLIERRLTSSTMTGVLLIVATLVALVFANTGLADLYFRARNTMLGIDFGFLNLRLSLGAWAADGLLAVFFFMVGLELKRQFVLGDLRSPKRALFPIAAAFGGVAIPAIIYVLINVNGPEGALNGWAIPAATDIAFAVAILAIVGKNLPEALRTFLLALAVVDDLIAITIIAIFYSSNLELHYLVIAIIPLVVYWFLANKFEDWFRKSYVTAWILLLPLAIIVWALFYNSGIHATIAGVVLGFLVPVSTNSKYGPDYSLSETFEHRFTPLSVIVCVPTFAFFSAGVNVGGFSGLIDSWTSTVALGIIVGLVLGKIVGILGMTALITRVTSATLDPSIKWVDLFGMSALGGIGFTVSLLVAELSFPADSILQDHAKVGVLTASVLASVLGAILLLPRNKHYATIAAERNSQVYRPESGEQVGGRQTSQTQQSAAGVS